MAKEGIITKATRWETHHRIAAFSIVLVLSIILTRLAVLIRDPNPVILGLELHHFDYGILILLITSQLSLFGPRKLRDLYIFLTAIGTGFILDEYWIIRHGVDNVGSRLQQYNSTLFSVMILTSVVILATLFVSSILRHRKNK